LPDGVKALYADVLVLAESRLPPGSLVLADDARHCADL
jgi:predicted O-methyltransferase YrrM